jgi:transposase
MATFLEGDFVATKSKPFLFASPSSYVLNFLSFIRSLNAISNLNASLFRRFYGLVSEISGYGSYPPRSSQRREGDEWGFLLPYLLRVREDAGQRQYPLRELFNALRFVVRTGCTWRYLPHDLPPWATCYQQRARWRDARVFEALTDDLRQVLRLNEARAADLSAVIFDSRTLQSTPESGRRAGYDGAMRRKGSKVHMAVDTQGDLLATVATPANEQDWAQVGALAE